MIALGFLLIVSLVVDAGLKAFSGFLPFSGPLLMVLSIAVSVALLTVLFAAIFKFLPATPVAWRDVKFGAIVTAVLFEAGKFLIGMYLGSSAAVTSLGAAGALLALLFWVYYSSQIFLFGAALTKARAEASGRSGISQTIAPASAPKVRPSSSARKEAHSSVLTLALTILARALVLMIVEGWERKTHSPGRRR